MAAMSSIGYPSCTSRADPLAATIGFLGFLGAVLPHFAHAFDVGLHNRVVGWIFLAVASFLAVAFRFRTSHANFRDLIVAALLLALCIVYSTPEQIAEITQPPTRDRYAIEKLAMTLQFCCPTILAGYILSSLRDIPSFWSGVRTAAILSAIGALVVLFTLRDLVVAQTLETRQELLDRAVFSPGGLSTILCLGAIAVASLPFAALFTAAVVMVQQRAHLGILALVALRHMRPRIRTVLLSLPILCLAWTYRDEIVGESVAVYWDGLLHGDHVSVRSDALIWSFAGFIDDPLGHGYGSFAIDYPYGLPYPHNIVAEASYELGMAGAFVCLLAVGTAVCRFLRRPMLATAFAFFTVLHLLKSSDLAQADLFWFFLMLSRK